MEEEKIISAERITQKKSIWLTPIIFKVGYFLETNLTAGSGGDSVVSGS